MICRFFREKMVFLQYQCVSLRRNEYGKAEASSQMASRHYADAYSASHKRIICLSLVFDKENRGLVDWKTNIANQK